MSLASLMDDPTIPDDVKRQAFARSSAGDRREYYYERLANPARKFVARSFASPLEAARATAAGRPVQPNVVGRTVSNLAVPPDIEGAAQTAAVMAATGGLGTAGMLAKAGLVGAGELGGIAGGKLQGKDTGDAAMSAVPGALLAGVFPAISERTQAFEKGVSGSAVKKIGKATMGLFRRLFIDNPDIQPPTDAHSMHMLFGAGDASPAVVAAGRGLEKNRSIIRNLQKQPAFAGMPPVTVPYKTTNYIPGAMPQVQRGRAQVSLSDALDYLQGMYSKGYTLQGTPRGAIQAEPDRDIAALVRKQIVAHLQQIPKFGPRLAKDFEDYSHDYGVAKTLPQVFKADTVTPTNLLEHENVYRHLADPKVLNHLKNLNVDTQGYLEQVAPGGRRILPQDPAYLKAHGLEVPISAHIPLPKPPLVPPAFVPGAQKAMPALGAISGQQITQAIEGDN